MISSLHRPTVATVNLQAIKDNIENIQEHIPKQTKVYAVVKANAYGHGAVAVSTAIASQVDAYCVSNLDEALELRQAGIRKEILILAPILARDLPLAISHDLTVTVASLEWVEMLSLPSSQLDHLRVHVKVDSGMGRIGVRSVDEANQLIGALQARGAQVDGVFTHFATADEANSELFDRQLAFFKDLISKLDYQPSLVHASNSATSLWHSDTIFNAVRLGIAMYGLNPSGKVLQLPYALESAFGLESCLTHVKQIEAGESVGYGATYIATQTECIGTVPIGYADGWTRDMQGFYLLVDGHFCEIVGRVSMDQITIRLPKPYAIGTKVTLIGRQQGHDITATDIAQYRDTINYEVLCLLSDRIPRNY